MITSIFEFALGILTDITSPLAKLSFTVSEGFYQVLENYLAFCLYIFPFYELMPIVVFIFSMFMFRIAISLVKTIWQLLPVL